MKWHLTFTQLWPVGGHILKSHHIVECEIVKVVAKGEFRAYLVETINFCFNFVDRAPRNGTDLNNRIMQKDLEKHKMIKSYNVIEIALKEAIDDINSGYCWII